MSIASTAGTISVGDIKGLEAKAAVIGTSLRGIVGIDDLRALNQRNSLVAADRQGLVRVPRGQELVHEPWPEMEDTLPN